MLIYKGGKTIITRMLTFPNNIQKNSLRAMRNKFPRIFKSKWEKESRGWRKCLKVSFIISAAHPILLHDEMKKVKFGEGYRMYGQQWKNIKVLLENMTERNHLED
jgi:hypothetical protein